MTGYSAQSAAGIYLVSKEEHDFDRKYKLKFVQNGKWEYVRNFDRKCHSRNCCWKMTYEK